MKNFLNKALIQTEGDKYLAILILVAPLLNFLSGINLDLYTPSLPAIAHYYSASIVAVKNTITVSMIGFALGCIIFGTAFDILGRRRVILFGLLSYIIASFLALFCVNIHQLILVRFIQGMMVSSVSVGGRSYIIDNFTGHQYNLGILYTSLAYGLGPIISPFIGGILQHHFNWQANFLAYAFFAMGLIVIFALYVNESNFIRQTFSLKKILANYTLVMKHRVFMTGIIIMGICQFELMIYPTAGSFLVENILHHTAIVYGNTALLGGCGYLLGTLINRLLIKKISLSHIANVGFVLLVLSSIIQISFALLAKLNLFTLVLPIVLLGFSGGFVFPNMLGRNLRIFPQNAGVATATLTCLLVIIGAVGVFIISHINVTGLVGVAVMFAVAIIMQLFIYYVVFNPAENRMLHSK